MRTTIEQRIALILSFVLFLVGCGGAPATCNDHENTGWLASGAGAVAIIDTASCGIDGTACWSNGATSSAVVAAAMAGLAAYSFYNSSECHEREGMIRVPANPGSASPPPQP